MVVLYCVDPCLARLLKRQACFLYATDVYSLYIVSVCACFAEAAQFAPRSDFSLLCQCLAFPSILFAGGHRSPVCVSITGGPCLNCV